MIPRPRSAALSRHLPARALLLGVVLAVIVLTAACQRGGGSPTKPPSTSGGARAASQRASAPGDSKRGTGGGAGATGQSSTGAYTVAFARCMRQHGVPAFPNPTGNGQLGPTSGIDPTSTAFQTALNGACKALAPPNWLDDGPGSVPGGGA